MKKYSRKKIQDFLKFVEDEGIIDKGSCCNEAAIENIGLILEMTDHEFKSLCPQTEQLIKVRNMFPEWYGEHSEK